MNTILIYGALSLLLLHEQLGINNRFVYLLLVIGVFSFVKPLIELTAL